MELPRFHRLNTIYKQFGVEKTIGPYTGLPIRVSTAPRGMLVHLGLNPEIIFRNQQLEKAAKETAEQGLGQVAVPFLTTISKSVK